MSLLSFGGGDPHKLLSHMALLGAMSIAESAVGFGAVRASWSRGMQPRPLLSVDGLSAQDIAEIVRGHAAASAGESSWLTRTFERDGQTRGLMSPRIKGLDDEAWNRLEPLRSTVADELWAAGQLLDLRLLGGLGQPSHWHRDRRTGQSRQDDAASRFEMQPRNQGAEFVGSRLLPIAQRVARRSTDGVLRGLAGDAVVDELNRGKTDSRSATGFAPLGPADNAVVWCALWGLAVLPVAHQVQVQSTTTGHSRLRKPRGGELFHLPLWTRALRPPALRSLLADARLPRAVNDDAPSDEVRAAKVWLADRSVSAVVRFMIDRHGSASAPERRVRLGVLIPTGEQ